MKKILSAGLVIILFGFSLWLVGCSKGSTVKVKANKQVVELLRTWGPEISFYTSKKNPLKSIEGLRQEEIGCFGPELGVHIQAFYDAARIEKTHGDGVQVIGPDNPIFIMEHGPRLYLTSVKFAPKLKEAVKVQFTE
ncbi:MAG: hypothetical protein WA610_08130 [Thermodesulfovibrionales bacterium]